MIKFRVWGNSSVSNLIGGSKGESSYILKTRRTIREKCCVQTKNMIVKCKRMREFVMACVKGTKLTLIFLA